MIDGGKIFVWPIGDPLPIPTGTEHLFCFDPGGTTGVAHLWISPDKIWLVETWQVPNGVQGFLDWWKEEEIDVECDRIVSESFILREGLHGVDTTPLRIEGALAVLWPDNTTKMYQMPSTKSLLPDERQQKIGMWDQGHRHANDAIKHGLIYEMKKGHPAMLNALLKEDADGLLSSVRFRAKTAQESQ